MLAAMIAHALAKRGLSCALLEADLTGGGLDVLLGIEGNSGLCLQEIDAPLGNIDGKALIQELARWENVRVLPSAPWRGEAPDWWEVQAAVRALSDANQVLLVDAAHGSAIEDVAELKLSQHLVAVELSVMGLARARAHADALTRMGVRTSPLFVGLMPRGAGTRHGPIVAMAEATAYLGSDVLGPIKADTRLCAQVLEGIGIQEVPRCNKAALEEVATAVATRLGCAD